MPVPNAGLLPTQMWGQPPAPMPGQMTAPRAAQMSPQIGGNMPAQFAAQTSAQMAGQQPSPRMGYTPVPMTGQALAQMAGAEPGPRPGYGNSLRLCARDPLLVGLLSQIIEPRSCINNDISYTFALSRGRSVRPRLHPHLLPYCQVGFSRGGRPARRERVWLVSMVDGASPDPLGVVPRACRWPKSIFSW